MIDGLKSADYKADDITVSDDLAVEDNVSGTGLDLYAATATVAWISGAAVYGTTVNSAGKLVSACGAGSPTTTWGQSVLAGSSATGAGSNAWLTFPTAFSAAPIVVASQGETKEALLVPIGSLGVGSFYIETTSASQAFSWVALGN